MSSQREGGPADGLLIAQSTVDDWLAAGDNRTDEEKSRDAAEEAYRHLSKTEKARARREAERVRIRRDIEANEERCRALDAADTSGNPIPHRLREPLGKLIFAAARDYMRDQQHRADFEAWYLERHGTPYVWPGTAERKNEA